MFKSVRATYEQSLLVDFQRPINDYYSTTELKNVRRSLKELAEKQATEGILFRLRHSSKHPDPTSKRYYIELAWNIAMDGGEDVDEATARVLDALRPHFPDFELTSDYREWGNGVVYFKVKWA